KYPAGRLPAVADLPAEQTARCIVATLAKGWGYSNTEIVVDVPALVGRGATAIQTDVEPTPIIDRRNHWRWRLGVGPCGKISTEGRSDAQTYKTHRDQQYLLHELFPIREATDQLAHPFR